MALGHRITTVILCALGLAAWVVALAGMAVITNDCYTSYVGSDTYDRTGNGILTVLGQNCVSGLSMQWWGLWFEFIVLFIIIGYAFAKNLALHQSTLQALLAVVTAVDMWNANVFLYNQNYVHAVYRRQSGLNCAAAGFIMFCTFNMFLIFVLGSGFVWFGETDGVAGGGGGAAAAPGAYGGKGASAAARPPGPNFAAPATFASPLSGGGARAYLPNTPGGEPTVSAVRE